MITKYVLNRLGERQLREVSALVVHILDERHRAGASSAHTLVHVGSPVVRRENHLALITCDSNAHAAVAQCIKASER